MKQKLIEALIQVGYKAYQKMYRNTPEGRCLDRHQQVTVEGVECLCYRELAAYKAAQYLNDALPDADIVLNLDGNNTTLSIDYKEEDEPVFNQCIQKVFEDANLDVKDFM